MIVAKKYELVRKIGAGAMGEVWAARHQTLELEVAIKLVMHGVEHGDETSAESRFLREARIAAQLSRKTRHIVVVTDHGQDGPLDYLTMELLVGESLDARIARTGPLPVSKVAPMITQIARGLAIAHGEGVVHRDLKPSNVFVTLDEEGNAVAKILDFGIAKLRRGLDHRAAPATQPGLLLGTPAYMSPEQARGESIDHRADVWALAVIAYNILTGEFPFDGESGQELFDRICRVEPISIRERLPDAPPILGDFFTRAFAPRVQARFQSALALAGAFEQLEPLAAGAKLSLPPPPPALSIINAGFEVAGLPREVAKALSEGPTLAEEASLLVVGLPPRKRLLPLMIATALVGVVLASTGALLSVYFEREPALTSGALSRGATADDPHAFACALLLPAASADRSGGLTLITSEDLPAAAAPRATYPALRTPSNESKLVVTPRESNLRARLAGASTTAAPAAPHPAAKPAPSFDKSEIF